MVQVQLKLQRRCALIAVFATLATLVFVPAAGASAYIYWWQRNMASGQVGYDRTAHNRTYNELYFGANAGWRSEVWEVTPAGYRHFDKWCTGNCFNAHPGSYYSYAYCSNRDDYGTHFVYECKGEW